MNLDDLMIPIQDVANAERLQRAIRELDLVALESLRAVIGDDITNTIRAWVVEQQSNFAIGLRARVEGRFAGWRPTGWPIPGVIHRLRESLMVLVQEYTLERYAAADDGVARFSMRLQFDSAIKMLDGGYRLEVDTDAIARAVDDLCERGTLEPK